jgi:serine/threonine protein kinase/ABC-type branched-subunit amino acid transport system substrate-binding protein
VSDPAVDDTAPRSLGGLRQFGKYVLVQKLAEGGMAEIFLAKQIGVEGFERNVVIKRMLSHLSSQPEFVDMFLDEARLAARLTHPNIIPIYDLGQAEGSFYICMEYLPGEDLAWILRHARNTNRQLPIGVAVRILADAARGLHYAHEFAGDDGRPMNVVHRDVSPGNIFVGYAGEVKVLDFGIAKAESRVTSTNIGTIKGKALYMSPEQSLAEPIDRRADVFSLGVTLYEALTVSRPFARDSAAAVVDAVVRGEFDPPRKRRPELPADLERVVLRAMARKPEERFATCAQMADELEHAFDSTTPTGTGAVGRFLRDLAGEAQVAQKTRIPSLQTLEKDGMANRTPVAPVSRAGTRRRRRLAIAAGSAAALVMGGTLFFALYRPAPAPEGCGPHSGSEARDAIRIGATLPISVDRQTDDSQLQLLHALELALDEINQRDGVNGRTFALYACDNSGQIPRAKEQTRWLVDEVGVPVLVSSWSSVTLAAADITVPRGVLTITADATSPELAAIPATRDGVRMLWRTAPSDAMQGRVLVDLLTKDPAFSGLSRIGLLYQDDPYGQGLAGVVASGLAKAAPNLQVKRLQYPFRGDVTSQVRQLAASQPDLTLLVGFPLDAVRILNLAAREPALMREHGHRWFFSDSVKEPGLFNGLDRPEEIEGAYGLMTADGGGDEARSFKARFAARFQRNALDQTYASNRYDAMYLVAFGAAWALGPDGGGILDGVHLARGLTHLSHGARFGVLPEQFTAAKAALQAAGSIDLVGASGPLDFDDRTGEAPASFQLWRVSGRNFVSDRRIPSP